MSREEPLHVDILKTYGLPDLDRLETDYREALDSFKRKIVVMDDDPTGVQTVHHISVYTDWEPETILSGFEEQNSLFFILTNSRSMTASDAIRENEKIARGIVTASVKTGRDFVLISRSDSTLRGHYPYEPLALKAVVEQLTEQRFDGEIIFPFFKEGGRYTINNVHYVRENDQLIPAGLTEFARDAVFGYHASHLGEWCEEKTCGEYRADQMIYISLEMLRLLDYDKIEDRLLSAGDYNKIIVNAIDYCDVKAFAVAFIRALHKDKEFIIRSAAAVTKVLGGITNHALLTREELAAPDNRNGGMIVVGSHVNKTTRQLEALRASARPIEFIEFDVEQAMVEGGLARETERIALHAEELIGQGITVAVFTSRKLLDPGGMDKEKKLLLSVSISGALTDIVGRLKAQPSFIVAKGGITSSDVGTKALHVRRALVMGQIKPGIPVWMTDDTSKFPNMPYVIFPGNVGSDTTLREVVEILLGEE